MSAEPWFPIQQGGRVDWAAAEQAYRDYSNLYGTGQSLERLAERGGFGVLEFCEHFRAKRVRGSAQETIAKFVLAVADELGPRWQREGSHG